MATRVRGLRDPRTLAALVAAGISLTLVAACGSQGSDRPDHEAASAPSSPATSTPTDGHSDGHTPTARPTVAAKPLRPGERRISLRMPGDYTPKAPTGVGTDDYRCFLLDPALTQDAFITGFNVLPGNPDVVHHVILFRAPPDKVRAAEQLDAASPGQGWTCFGDSGVGGGMGQMLDNAPWLGAWAPGGAESVGSPDRGTPLPKGSRIVMQVHYNLLAGTSPDRSAAQIRVSDRKDLTPIRTVLVPAPVELPCRPGKNAKLCDRDAAYQDLTMRFGHAAATANLLHLLCGEIKAGPVQSCLRYVKEPETVRGVAGHMHLLGKSIKVETNPGTPRARTILDIPVWDFDDQGSRAIKPVKLKPFDTVRVTCRHGQGLRDRLPAFEGTTEKYVMWGEGTTDEMCLAMLQVTRP